MWEEFILDRNTNKVDDLCANFTYEEHPQVMEVYLRGYYGIDRTGHPVYYDFSGKINPDEVLKVTTEERFFNYIYADYERCLKYRLLAMSHITQMQLMEITSIVDLKGFGITRVTKKAKAILG